MLALTLYLVAAVLTALAFSLGITRRVAPDRAAPRGVAFVTQTPALACCVCQTPLAGPPPGWRLVPVVAPVCAACLARHTRERDAQQAAQHCRDTDQLEALRVAFGVGMRLRSRSWRQRIGAWWRG